MTRTVAALVLIAFVAGGSAGDAFAGNFGRVHLNASDLTTSNFQPVTPPPVVCVPHAHHQCPNPPGSTIPDCRGGHMGPNGVMIDCK